jgi:Glycosyltransferases involved in cell wall biogenesis
MISVIVPVYNCEKYLHDGINSLIKQTIFNNLEIIFIDDGSTDNSLEIISTYIKKYNNMKCFHQSNMGVSAARNVGIKMAQGKYIAFFDADDVAKPTLYEKLFSLCEKNEADISIVDYSMVFKDGVIIKHRNPVTKEWTNKNDLLKSFMKENIICTNPVDKLFSAELARKISFPEGYAIGEDMYYVFQALCCSKKVVIDSSESLYLYFLRDASSMKTQFNNKHIDAVRLSKKIIEALSTNKVVLPYAEANYIHEICKMLALLFRSGNVDEYKEKISFYTNEIRNYSFFKSLKYMSTKHMLALTLMKLSPNLYLFLYTILRIG